MWLEKEVSNNLVEGEYNGLLINGVVEITRKENVRDYFHDLAVESAKHEATIPFNPFKKVHLTDRDFTEQAAKLFPLAISYSAGLIERFYQEVR